MLNFSDETMWLTITNIGLGLVVLAACVVVLRVFAVELFGRFRKSFATAHSSEHELFVSDLGLTMADGGERVDAKAKKNDSEATKK
jgi:hypothetical protein